MLIKIFRVFLIVLFVAVIGFVVWGSTPLGPSPEAQAATASGSGVVVEQPNGWMVFRPDGNQPSTGLIFYPGGRVEYRSYAPLLRQIAERGYLVVLVPQPLNLAIFGIEKAAEVIAAYPQVQSWAIGGHSLGGSMAAQYVINHGPQVKGLVLWASYPPAAMDQRVDLRVVSISGSLDGLATTSKIDESRKLLPAQTHYVILNGGDHAQFGSYGPQPGDNPAAISPAEQWAETAQATVDLLDQISGK